MHSFAFYFFGNVFDVPLIFGEVNVAPEDVDVSALDTGMIAKVFQLAVILVELDHNDFTDGIESLSVLQVKPIVIVEGYFIFASTGKTCIIIMEEEL